MKKVLTRRIIHDARVASPHPPSRALRHALPRSRHLLAIALRPDVPQGLCQASTFGRRAFTITIVQCKHLKPRTKAAALRCHDDHPPRMTKRHLKQAVDTVLAPDATAG